MQTKNFKSFLYHIHNSSVELLQYIVNVLNIKNNQFC